MLSMMCAIDKNNGLGFENELLCYLKDDMKIFKSFTTDKTVVMGRSTFESIEEPLPNRRNIVLSRDKDLVIEGVEVFNNYEDIVKLGESEDVVIIGGQQIYELFLPYTHMLHVSHIDHEFENVDSYFPQFYEYVEKDMEQLNFTTNTGNLHNFTYKVYSLKRHF